MNRKKYGQEKRQSPKTLALFQYSETRTFSSSALNFLFHSYFLAVDILDASLVEVLHTLTGNVVDNLGCSVLCINTLDGG